MPYKVLYGFVDVVEEKNYREGDEYVLGKKTDAKRIETLSGYANALRRPLIEKVDVYTPPVENDPGTSQTEGEPGDEDSTESSDLSDHTVEELKAIATEKGLEFKARMSKAELIALIEGE